MEPGTDSDLIQYVTAKPQVACARAIGLGDSQCDPTFASSGDMQICETG